MVKQDLITQLTKHNEVDDSFFQNKLVWLLGGLFALIFCLSYSAMLVAIYGAEEWRAKQGLISIIKPDKAGNLHKYIQSEYADNIKSFFTELGNNYSPGIAKSFAEKHYLIRSEKTDKRLEYIKYGHSSYYVENSSALMSSAMYTANELSKFVYEVRKSCDDVDGKRGIKPSENQPAKVELFHLDCMFKSDAQPQRAAITEDAKHNFDRFRIEKLFYYGGSTLRLVSPAKPILKIPEKSSRPWYTKGNGKDCKDNCIINIQTVQGLEYWCRLTDPYLDLEPSTGITRTIICSFSFDEHSTKRHHLGFDFTYHFDEEFILVGDLIPTLKMVYGLEWTEFTPEHPEILLFAFVLSIFLSRLLFSQGSVGRVVEVSKISQANVNIRNKKSTGVKLLSKLSSPLKSHAEGFYSSVTENNHDVNFNYGTNENGTLYYNVKINDIKQVKLLFFSRRHKSKYDEGNYSVNGQYVESIMNSNELRQDVKKLLVLNQDKDEYSEHILHDNVIRDSLDNFHRKIKKTDNFTIAVSNFASLQYGEFRFINGKGLMKEVLELGRVQVYAVANEQSIKNIITYFKTVLSTKVGGNKHLALKSFMVDWFFQHTSIRIVMCESVESLQKLLGKDILNTLVKESLNRSGSNNKSLYIYDKSRNDSASSVKDGWLTTLSNSAFFKRGSDGDNESKKKEETSLSAIQEQLKQQVMINGSIEDFAILQSTGQNKEYIGLMTADYQTFRFRSRMDDDIPVDTTFSIDCLDISYSGTLYTTSTYIVPFADYYKKLLSRSELIHHAVSNMKKEQA